MKRILLVVAVALVAGWALALPPQPGYYFFYFSTWGDECYSDGSLALEGECYALVWRSEAWKDKVTGLFNADGTSTDPDNCQVVAISDKAVVRHLDIDGTVYACADGAYLQVPYSHLYSKYVGSDYVGVYSLFIFDTRVRQGDRWVVGGKASDTTVRALNGYGVVTDFEDIPVDDALGIFWSGSLNPNYSFLDNPPLAWGDDTGPYSGTTEKALVPADCPVPAFSAMSVADGVATVSVTNTAPYLAYDLSRSDGVATVFTTTNCTGDVRQGVGAGPLTWTIPLGTAPTGFFRPQTRSVDDQ